MSHTLTSADDAVYDGLVGDVVTVTVDDDDEVRVTVVPDTVCRSVRAVRAATRWCSTVNRRVL